MARECNHMTTRRRFGDLMVIAKAGFTPDGVFRCNFICRIIPDGGTPVETEIRSHYGFLAAEEAARIYREGME